MSPLSRSLFTSQSDRWGTPPDFFARLDAELRFSVDVCAEPWSAKCPRFWTAKASGLHRPWNGEHAWMNPPYSQVEEWMRRAHSAARNANALVCCLVPARTDTEWWQQHVVDVDGEGGPVRGSRYDDEARVWWVDRERCSTATHFVPGRLRFELAARRTKVHSAPFPSAVVLLIPRGMPAPTRARPAGEHHWLTRLWPDSDAVRALAQAARPGRVTSRRSSAPVVLPLDRGGHFHNAAPTGENANGTG